MEIKNKENLANLIIFDFFTRKDYLWDFLFSDDEIAKKKIKRKILSFMGDEKTDGTYMQEFICRLIAGSKNAFSVFSERGELPKIIYDITLNEIKIIKEVFNEFAEKDTKDFLYKKIDLQNTGNIEKIKIALTEKYDLKTLEILKDYYSQNGYGNIGEFTAFYLEDDELKGIKEYEKMQFSNLIGYDIQKNKIIENISLLLKNKKAENMLLYGDAGTGKSSSIKACLTEFEEKGLKLISLTKDQIIFIPKLFRKLEKRGIKFIIFIDDLSFEKTEETYKILKSILEGRIEKKPDNIIFAVTTNRKNLVKESWKDRDSDDDMHIADTISENRSLKDRFSLYLSFMKPNKKEYLNIVFSLANKADLINKTAIISNEKIKLEKEYIEKESLMFERRHGGMTGRAAKTFVDFLISRTV
ncbi:MAG: ATP-binding protein [Clostridiales Family XIII bacterium]|jgi:predicted AAA+ superfamily ATPase|nr:ATP-binding protein [Clostridiales Family XIII bacterium]